MAALLEGDADTRVELTIRRVCVAGESKRPGTGAQQQQQQGTAAEGATETVFLDITRQSEFERLRQVSRC